jgi:uncharacterized protein Yka (UPF0111/DUF47 family)
MRLTVPLLIAALLFCTSPMQAQWRAMTPAERQELVGYRLTMDNITKTVAASAKLRELEKDPKMKAMMDKYEATSLTDAITQMNAVPQIRSAIEGSGLTSKQFMFTVIELASTATAARLQAMSGGSAEAIAQIPTSPENLQFYAAHQAEIDPLTAQLRESDDSSGE